MGKSVIYRYTLLMFFFLGMSNFLLAQENVVINGIVKDSADGKPISSAVIKVVGSKSSTIVREDGSFSIKASIGSKLIISHISYNSKTIAVDGTDLNILLGSKSVDQEGVVVVAMDMKRKPRELGYSVQTVTGKDIQESQRENFINALQGRAAGVTINPTSGQAGASSQIVLRGFNSLSGKNQPLFIIDGIILDNTTFSESNLADNRPGRTNDYTNRIADINPNDIASLTILKGPEATALYGSQASAGAIVITTKKPSGKGVRVSYDNSFRFNKVTRFPKLLNNYSPGNSGIPYSTGYTYFGPAYPDGTKYYDNVHEFFKTGFANTQNLAADFGGKVSSFRLSSSYFKNSGIIPYNNYERSNIKLGNVTHIGKIVDITPAITFITSNNRRPMKGSGGFMLNLFDYPAVLDARNYQDSLGNKKLIFYSDPNSEIDNPFFNAYRNFAWDKTDRWIATMGVDIRPFSWLAVAGRFGYDTYKTRGFILTDPQSAVLTSAQQGSLSVYNSQYKGYNHTITATANKKYGKLGTRVMIGTMWQNYETDSWGVWGTNLKDASKTQGHSTDSTNIGVIQARLQPNYFGRPKETVTRQIAYFGEVAVNWNELIYLSYTQRFESASVFPVAFRNYNYPGFSISAIMSDIIPGIKGDVLNFWKLRASRASTALLMAPYANQSTFVNNYASATDLAYSYDFYNNNPNMKPERQKTYEIGTELRMFKNRVSLEAAYYNTHNLDQISQGFRASYGTGFVLNTMNASESRNQGVEITLNLNPIKSQNLDWNIQFNFNHMWSKVLAIPKSIDGFADYYNSDTWSAYNVRSGFIKNKPTTILTGYSYQRNNKGDILINPATGLPLINTNFTPIADRNPKFTLGTLNTFRYKNFYLSFLWDLRVGGDIFNATDMYLTYVGKSERTKDRKMPRVIKGVLNDGLQNSATPTPNSIEVTPYYISNYYYSETNGLTDEEFVQKKVNWFRLRDITLSYMLPQNITSKIKCLRSLSVFATANDLILFTNYRGADPAVNGNNASTTGVGGFGIDYGNVATPVSCNFGIKANF